VWTLSNGEHRMRFADDTTEKGGERKGGERKGGERSGC